MTYSVGTGDYESDFLERILDTDFRYGVPYKIDREKYESTLKEFHQEMRVEDADVVVFHASYYKDNEEEGEIVHYAFFAWPQNSPEGSDDFYECSIFQDYTYDNKHKEAFEEFVRAMLKCIIEPDEEHVKKLIFELRDEVALKLANLDFLNNLIDENFKDEQYDK